MKTRAWMAMVALISTGAACGGASVSEGSADETEIPDARPADRRGTWQDPGTTIYAIQRPGSPIPSGAEVVLDAPEIKVTAVADGLLWIQEAGASGLCEVSTEPVAYRGIAVAPLAIDRGLVPGQRVRVEGRVAELDGDTTIVDATVTRIGEPGTPYEAHCERDGAVLQGEALEGVLVMTAGTSDGYDEPQDGVWQIETCFAPAEETTFLVGDLMYENDSWSPSWQWVTGVMRQSGARRLLEPRGADDVVDEMGDDVCL